MIRFPQRHIADDVADRIARIAKSLQTDPVAMQGQQLEQALQQPIGDVAAIEGIEDAIPLKALNL